MESTVTPKTKEPKPVRSTWTPPACLATAVGLLLTPSLPEICSIVVFKTLICASGISFPEAQLDISSAFCFSPPLPATPHAALMNGCIPGAEPLQHHSLRPP